MNKASIETKIALGLEGPYLLTVLDAGPSSSLTFRLLLLLFFLIAFLFELIIRSLQEKGA